MNNIHTLFEQQVLRTPEHIAVDTTLRRYTYHELNRFANELAHALLQAGLTKDVIVNTWLPPGFELITALLAVFKAGGIYLPLDRNFSEKRMQQVFAGTFSGMLISRKESQHEVAAMLKSYGIKTARVLLLDENNSISLWQYEQEAGPQQLSLRTPLAEKNPELEIDPAAGSYIFYTSGSTGEGKAILGNNRSLCQFISWEIRELGIDQHHRISQLAQITFDASFKDIFTAICSGATVCIPPREVKENASLLLRWIEDQQLTVLQCVPSVFRLLLKALSHETRKGAWFPALKHVLLAGEMLYGRDLIKWNELVGGHVEIINLYGTTESTVLKTFHRIHGVPANPAQIIHVGKPIDDAAVAVINDGHLCRPGEKGEVYIRTPYLTNGYLNNEELNATVFVQNPLKDTPDIVYRTGDTGRYLKDGNLEILGRRDKQVKVNGIRVELGEVESAVLGMQGIDEAVVVPWQDDDAQTVLVCYYTNPHITVNDLRQYLGTVLNEGLMPARFIQLGKFPLNINGKVNKKLLPSPDKISPDAVTADPPLTETERLIAGIWEQVLGATPGRNVSFFEAGGNSLKGIQITSRLYQVFGANIRLTEVFRFPTIAALAALVDDMSKGAFEDIVPVEEQDYYGLSYEQSRLWALNRIEEEQDAYNMHAAYTIEGDLDRTAFEQAIVLLVARHESLRTSFTALEGNPVQRIRMADNNSFALDWYDLSSGDTAPAVLRNTTRSYIKKPFDLEQGSLIRVALFRLSEREHLCLIVMHHIAADGWSTEIISRETAALYNACRRQANAQLPELKLRYKDFIAWQRKQMQGERLEQLRSYWLQQFSGELPVLDLPGSYPRPVVRSYNGHRTDFLLDEELSRSIRAYGKEKATSLFTVLLSAMKHLFFLYTGKHDIVMGTPAAGRHHAGLETLVGFFINNLPLRTCFEGTDSFDTLVEKVRKVTNDAFDHEQYPFHLLVNELGITRDPGRSLLYDTGFTWHTVAGTEKTNEPAFDLKQFDTGFVAARADLWFHGMDTAAGIKFFLEYSTDLFERNWIERLVSHFLKLLKAVITDPEQQLVDITILSEADVRQQLLDFHGPLAPAMATFVEHFETRLPQVSDHIAIRYGATGTTYRELNAKADRLAHFLQGEWQAGPGTVIALMPERSERMIIGLLGILKAGAAFLPLDPVSPPDRLLSVLADAGADHLLTDASLLYRMPQQFSGKIFALDIQLDVLEDGPEALPPVNAPADLAYVIYTSGSTGKPKGVAVQHSNLTNYLLWANRYYFNDQAGHTFGVFTSLAFDLTITSIFTTLLRGDLLVIGQQQEVDELLLYLFDPGSGVNTLKVTPSHIALLHHLPLERTGVNTLIVGGEVLEKAHVEKMQELNPGISIYNEYGPTETTVGCTIKKVTGIQDLLTIGKPIDNTGICILNEHRQLVPLGVPGEICVSGRGVARGYLNDLALTERKFIQHPLFQGPVYCTGDLGKWTPEGELIFLGRKDEQVKIRGYRVETAEIEQAIMQHPAVDRAVVLPVPAGTGEMQLVACFTRKEMDTSGLTGFLHTLLPHYMMPSRFVEMEKLPLNSNGKIDRKALKAKISTDVQEQQFVAPRNRTEEQLAAIWEEALGRTRISINDNFFALGGHSLKAIQVIYQVQRRFRVKLKPGDLFTYSSIEMLAAEIDKAPVSIGDELQLRAIEEQEHYPVSQPQAGLWLFDQAARERRAFNVTAVYRLEGPLDRNAFDQAFTAIVERHEILRTVFITVNGAARQQVLLPEQVNALPDYADISGDPDQESRINACKDTLAAAPFELAAGPLFRSALLCTGRDEHLFFFTIHHIISDEWSHEVLLNDLVSCYMQFHAGATARPALAIQYKDYTVWHNRQLQDPALRDYWYTRLKGGAHQLNLPIAGPRMPKKTYAGDRFDFELDAVLTNNMRSYCVQEGVSLYMLLMAALKAILYRYTGQDDLMIGATVAGREDMGLAPLVGNFVNLLPLRTSVAGEQGFAQLLEHVKAVMLGAFDHQAYPYSSMVNDLGLDPDESRAYLFDIGFTWHDAAITATATEEGATVPGIKIKQVPVKQAMAKADMWLHAVDNGTHIACSVIFAVDLFEKPGLDRFFGHYKMLLSEALKLPYLPLNELPYLLPEEEKEILAWSAGRSFDHPSGKTIVEIFEEQAERTPDAIAVCCQNRALSYRELNNKANQVAHYLLGKYQVQPGDIVGMIMSRSEWIPVCLLGILKSGAVYLPCDPDNPGERLSYVLENARTRILITQSDMLIHVMEYYQGPMIVLDMELDNGHQEYANPGRRAQPDDIAYVIYTSGTTGRPKGVMVMHRNLVNLIEGLKFSFTFRPEWKYITAASVSFDSSLKQMLVPLTLGGELNIVHRRKDIEGLVEYIKRRGINAISTTPSTLQAMLEVVKQHGRIYSMKYVASGGEQLTAGLANQLQEAFPGAFIVNVYGPTETTDLALTYPISGHQVQDPPLGRPLPYCEVYILDERLQLRPAGVKGEICIGGRGVSRGYLHNQEITAQQFVPHPFRKDEWLYRTGDMGMMDGQGYIHFLGRADRQVKIRGHRVELGEIERTLLRHKGVQSAVAHTVGSDDDKEIALYFVKKTKIVLRPSWAEQFAYDDMAYYAMSADHFRNERYRQVLARKVKDKVVLEVGPGSEAVLSVMCAACGAKKIYAVELFEEAYRKASAKVAQLGLADRITVIHGDITQVHLPEKVDVCVSEIVGSIGGSQGAAPIMNAARHWLQDANQMVPAQSVSRIAAITLPPGEFDFELDEVGAHYVEKIFHNVGRRFDLRLCLHNIQPRHLISTTAIFEDLDYRKENTLEDEHEISLEITKGALLHGFMIWLCLHLGEGVVIDTLWNREQQLWLPVFFPAFSAGVALMPGDRVKARVIRKLSADGVHPDYCLEGKLYSSTAGEIPFTHYSFNESPIFKGSHFYQQVFPEDSARICESVHGAGIREYLAGFLPQYMMPSYIVELEELPLNSHGKVDYQALPEPGEKEWQQRMAIVGPGNATEAGLLAIWQDVLKREHISVRDPFFTVGGHSLRAAQLIARIHHEFGVSLELKDLFVNPTIAELASKIAASNADVQERIRPVEDQVHYAVSHAQKRLWLLHQQEDNLNIYNSPIVMELKGDFSPGAFNNAMQALTARHESLRTVFVTISGEPRQRVVPPEDARYRVSYQDLRGETDTDKRISALIRKHSHTPFDLERGPLWRCSILHTADNAYLLLFAIHHIITDAVSMRVLLKELMLLYRQQTLPSLSLQYRDYATWQRSQLRGERLEGHRNYWRRQFGDEVPVLDLQTDYSRTAQADHEGDSVNITLDPVITQQLRQYAGENNATLFMTLLALVNALLYKYTGQTDIVTGTNVAGRDHQDLENQIGLFLNTLPLRVSFDEDKGLSELLTTVKTAVLGAFTHQAYPFDLLVGGLNIPHERSRNPLFDVEVELINVELDNTAAGEMDNMEARGYENGFSGAKDDLSFRFTEAGGRLMLSLRFRTALFERSTIERMAAHFIQVTTHALNSPGTPLSALDYMTAAEKEQILSAFKEQ